MLPAVIDATAVRLLFFALAAWLHQRDADAIAYLLEENRTLRAHIGHSPLRFNDDQRRRLAVLGHRLGRARATQKTCWPNEASPSPLLVNLTVPST